MNVGNVTDIITTQEAAKHDDDRDKPSISGDSNINASQFHTIRNSEEP